MKEKFETAIRVAKDIFKQILEIAKRYINSAPRNEFEELAFYTFREAVIRFGRI